MVPYHMKKTVSIEFGSEALHIVFPGPVDVLRLPERAPLEDPAGAIRDALAVPVGPPPLTTIVHNAVARQPDIRAVIVVSDNTRPVPYRGPASLVDPLLELLRKGKVREIILLVAAGTHRPLREPELRRLLPDSAFAADVRIVNHDCCDKAGLVRLGQTPRGTDVWINRAYLDAGIRILTGLVEPHFMAGMSGGPKSICPGIVGEAVTHVFHGARMMADARACSMQLDGNPCHEESLAVARMAGADFILNVTLNGNKAVTGVYAGDLVKAHRAACAQVVQDAGIPISREYDVLVTHAGFAGINHYQAAKAAVEASRALRAGGVLVLAANHTDDDPVGGRGYRSVLPRLREWGADELDRRLLAPDWQFVPEQWEVQMWARVFRKLGPAGRLVYCAPRLTGGRFLDGGLPGQDGGAGLDMKGSDRDQAERMVQQAVDQHAGRGRVAVLAEGPYGVPILTTGSANR